jgi:hypothetical protein
MIFVVAEAHGACRLYQDYLAKQHYRHVIIGHAKSMRYNAGHWPEMQYGSSLREREDNMIDDCYSAVVIWQDKSSVIAENLERLKQLKKPTYLFEYESSCGVVFSNMLDFDRTYRVYFPYRK